MDSEKIANLANRKPFTKFLPAFVAIRTCSLFANIFIPSNWFRLVHTYLTCTYFMYVLYVHNARFEITLVKFYISTHIHISELFVRDHKLAKLYKS